MTLEHLPNDYSNEPRLRDLPRTVWNWPRLLLLGLIREGDGIAARILVTYVGLDDARSETIKIIGDKSPANTGRPGMPFLRKTSFSQKPATGEMQKSPTTPILEQLADLQRRVTALESTVGEEGAE